MSAKNQTTASRPTFHLGITMAGAVSAGAYTAGFMDYLLEALSEWEKAKKINSRLKEEGKAYDLRVPMYDVVIDVIGGASAGGMISMITTLSFYLESMKPVKKVSLAKTGNLLYDSWVFLDDDPDTVPLKQRRTTFEKMLDTSDIREMGRAPSLLNSKPIDTMAARVFDGLPKKSGIKNFPSFVSDDLRLILTITSLKPIDYIVNFSRLKSAFLDSTPGHRISNHEIVAHFKLNFNAKKDKDEYLPFKPLEQKSRDFLIKVTKATGAFPLGLEPRHFEREFSTKYITNNLKKRLAFTQGSDVRFEQTEKEFSFTGVDGGTINNEPFDEVIRCLVSRHGSQHPDHPKFGTIMIDPFPNFYYEKEDSGDYQKNMLSVLSELVPTILDQARNKRNDTYGSGLIRLLVFPVKWEKKGVLRDHPPLATGGLGGFAGFLDRDFRIHDFFLGRDNARNFLRAFLFLEYNPEAPSYLFRDITDEAVRAFSRKVKDKTTGKTKTYMPLIPDLSKLDGDTHPFEYTVDPFPEFDKKAFNAFENLIRQRVKALLKAELKGKISNWLLRGVARLSYPFLAKKITKWILLKVEKDFAKRKM